MKKIILTVAILCSPLLCKAATFSIVIDDARQQRILDGFAIQNGYNEQITDETGQSINNPESKDKFFIRLITEFIIENVIATEGKRAGNAALQSAVSDAKQQLSGSIQVSFSASSEVIPE